MARMQHERHTSATRLLQEQHECDMSVIRAKIFHFDNDKSESLFSHPYVTNMANKRLQGEKQFHPKNYLLGIPCSHAKMYLKSTLKTELCNGKSYIKKFFARM